MLDLLYSSLTPLFENEPLYVTCTDVAYYLDFYAPYSWNTHKVTFTRFAELKQLIDYLDAFSEGPAGWHGIPDKSTIGRWQP